MVDECAACEADDELLFTCGYCSEQFCSAHQFPHHACEAFGQAGRAGDRSDPDDWFPASASGGDTAARDVDSTTDTDADGDDRTGTDRPDPSTPGDDPRPATVTPPEPSPRAESLSTGTWGRSGSLPVGASDGVVNVRPMDSRRVVGGTDASAAPRTIGDWISRQTYLTLLVKIGVIALLVNSAFYSGMAIMLYGLVPFAL